MRADADLAECEEIIERGLATFIEVGNALAAIRDGRLYRAGFATFEDYCRERWGFSRQRAQQFTAAAEAVTTIVDTDLPLPKAESQARELAKLPEKSREAVWRETLARTGGAPTARDVAETAVDLGAAADDYHERNGGRPEPKQSTPESRSELTMRTGLTPASGLLEGLAEMVRAGVTPEAADAIREEINTIRVKLDEIERAL